MIQPHHKVAILVEGAVGARASKMALGVMRYSSHTIVAAIDSAHAGQTTAEAMGAAQSVPIVATLEEARALGADVCILGISPPGGRIPPEWMPTIDRAVALGLSIVNGLHTLLAPRYPDLAEGQFIWDIRKEPEGLGLCLGLARHMSSRRLLTIGTDVAIGKMTAGLEIHRELIKRGKGSAFVATGQIGMTIMGSGIPLDAIRVDYAAHAVEREVLAADGNDFVLIEGQGSLANPGSTATLPLLRGSMPTDLVLCHRLGMTHLQVATDVPVMDLGELADTVIRVATMGGIYPRPVLRGLCINTSPEPDVAKAQEALQGLSATYGVVVVDPLRFGVGPLVDVLTSA